MANAKKTILDDEVKETTDSANVEAEKIEEVKKPSIVDMQKASRKIQENIRKEKEVKK